MIVAISYHPGDIDMARRWANHVKRLGPYLNHEMILCPSQKATTDGILLPLQNCFRSVKVVPNCHPETGWPVGCNRSFQTIAWHCMDEKKPFLFMEPDAVPLKEGWLDAIEQEYYKCGKPFMGDFVELSKVLGNQPGVIDHMSGVAVYHWDLVRLAPRVFNCTSLVKTKTGEQEMEFAWDIFAASDIIPKFHTTGLIQHDWTGTGDQPHEWRKHNVDWSFVNPNAVIYHPDKRGVLMNDGLAGEAPRVGGELRTGVPVSDPVVEQVSPAPIYEEDPKVQYPTTPQGTEEAQLAAIHNAISVLSFHSDTNRKFKRLITEYLAAKGWGKKRKKTKQPRKKVRPSLVGN
jgi:hypothetical protein